MKKTLTALTVISFSLQASENLSNDSALQTEDERSYSSLIDENSSVARIERPGFCSIDASGTFVCDFPT